MALPTVSVVVPAFNASATLGALLESLVALDYPDYEIIVVDDGSRDATAAIASRHTVTLLRQENRGASAARDAGLRRARGEIVAYTDSDTTVHPVWLRELVAPLADPRVGATTGRTTFLTDHRCTSWVRSLDILWRHDHRARDTHLANGPNCAFRREVLLGLGGFDPRWYHAEDTEVSYRLVRAGYLIRYVPSAQVFHVPEGDWLSFLRKRYRDALAYCRILLRYPREAVRRDDFMSLTMRVQPPLFGLLLLGAPLVMGLALQGRAGWLLPWTLLLGAGALLNLPMALRVVRESGRPTFLPRALVLTWCRGLAWGLGLIVGLARNLARGSPP